MGKTVGQKIGETLAAGAALAVVTAASIGATIGCIIMVDEHEHPEHAYPSSLGVITDLKESGCGVVTGELSNHFTFVAKGEEDVRALKEFKAENKRVEIFYDKQDQFSLCATPSTDSNGVTTYKPNVKAPANVVFKVSEGRILGADAFSEGTIKILRHESDGAVSGELSNNFSFFANNKEIVEKLEKAAGAGQKIIVSCDKADQRPTGAAGNSREKAPVNIVFNVTPSWK